MDNNDPTEGSGKDGKFFSGFLVGLLAGAFIVFLLGTKKGKKLLKTFSEEGLGNVSSIIDDENKSVDSDKAAKKPKREYIQKKEFAINEQPIEEKPRARHFFRGISRRVN